ncbi:MAG: GNAT family N-acetyltransferase [Planctomycetes bacterium]|nr:GNAT family N-acetyltransferase [Planctomycetota bacterium]
MAVIKKITDIDIPRLAELASHIWHAYFPAILSTEQIDFMVDEFQSALAISSQIEKGYEYVVAAEGDEWFGYCGMVVDGDDLFISKLYLKEEARGKGLGKMLFKNAENLAREKKCKRLTLTVNRDNELAINFYRRMGMSIIDNVVKDIGNGFVMDDHIFAKEL